MPKKIIFYGLGAGMVILSLSGCATTKKPVDTTKGSIEARAYMANKEREDQDMSEGNFGYLSGTPQPVDRSNVKKTREVYVVEFTKNPPEPKEIADFKIPERKHLPPREEPIEARPEPKRIEIPSFDDVDSSSARPEPQAQAGFVDYTVQKNDTLQKISKKFYDSYKKWPRIYEANKGVIPNPNSIKAGITLKIPMDGVVSAAPAEPAAENLK